MTNKALGELMREKEVFLFDFDGTLVDSMGMWARVDRTVVERHGARVPDNFLDMLIPLDEEQTAQLFLDFGCKGTVQSIQDEINELADRAYAEEIEPKPGAVELVKALKTRGARLGILTAATPARILSCLERIGLMGYFDLILSCDMVGLPKSDEKIYRTAQNYMKACAEDIVFFDDNRIAIATARRAGLTTVGVYDETSAQYWADMQEVAAYTVRSFTSLLDE